MSLLAGLAGFGAGVTASLAETKKEEMAMERQANLARLSAQYKSEIEADRIGRAANLVGRARQGDVGAQNRLTAMGIDYAEQESEPTTAMRNLDDRINRLMESNPGMSRDRATNIILNQEKVITDPVTGISSKLVPTGEGYELIQIPREEQQVRVSVETAPEVSPEDLAFDPGEAVGMFAVGKNLWNKTAGQFRFAPTFLGPEKAAQNITIVERDLINALASSGKPPVIEQERIMSLLPTPNVFLSNPKVANQQMAQVVDLLGIQRRDDLKSLANPNLNASLRQELESRVNSIESIVSRVLSPQASEEFLSYGVAIEGEVSDSETSDIDTYKQLFETERKLGKTPEIPYSLVVGYFDSPAQFFQRIKSLGFEPGQSFRYNGQLYQVPRG